MEEAGSQLLNFLHIYIYMYTKIMNDSDIDKLQIDLDRLGEWAVENVMKINPGKSKAVSFTIAGVKDPFNDFLGVQRIPEASSWN